MLLEVNTLHLRQIKLGLFYFEMLISSWVLNEIYQTVTNDTGDPEGSQFTVTLIWSEYHPDLLLPQYLFVNVQPPGLFENSRHYKL